MRESTVMDIFASDVLVIEDDADVRRAIGRTLGNAGYLVTPADNGLAGVEMVRRHSFGAIVTDVRMPVMNGLEFFEQLAADYPSLARRVVFVTAHIGDDDVGARLDQTGQPVLRKPFDTDELVGAVRKLMRESGWHTGEN